MKTYMCFCTHGHSHPLSVCLQVHIHALHTHAFASMFCRHVQLLLYSTIAQTGYTENTNYQVHQIYIFGTLATWRQQNIMPKRNTRDDIIIIKDNTHTNKQNPLQHTHAKISEIKYFCHKMLANPEKL